MSRQAFSVPILLSVFLIAVFSQEQAPAAESVVVRSKGQTIYVPVYSHIYSGDREHPFYLAATLSIRNTDPRNSIRVTVVDYYDSVGKLVEKYLKTPVTLAELASLRFIVKESDKAGGSGANFIVQWESEVQVNPPITESVMIGTQRQQGLSFTSRGQVIEEK
jgi:hypothetical protein